MFIDRWSLRRLCRARDLLHGDDPVAAIASAVQISPYHFIRQFDALFGETPHQYRTRVRLDRAKALLARGHTVTETCLEVGFSSPGSFSQLFSRHVGTTPSAFRRVVPAAWPVHANCFALMAIGFRNFREAGAGG